MARIDRIQAQDIMQKDVFELEPGMPIERAIEALEEHEISGAPVVDDAHRLIGMLATSDVTRVEHVRHGKIETTHGDWSLAETDGEEVEESDTEEIILDMEDFSPAVRGTDTVEDWMDPGVVTVDPEDSLMKVCRAMVRHAVHRVVVMRGKEIEGILTSFDVVRYVAGADPT